MRNRITFLGTVFVILVLLIASLVASVQLREAHDLVAEAAQASRQIRRLSDLMRQSTDDLTLMVRLYAVTGDPQYREYYQEILDIRNGEAPRPNKYDEADNYWEYAAATGERLGEFGPAISLRMLLQDPRFMDSELAMLPEAERTLLEKSEDLSNELALIEEEVMAAVEEQIAAGDGEYVLEGAALEGLQRLYSQEYLAVKLEILSPLGELEAASEQRIQDEIDVRDRRRRQLADLQLALVILATLLVAAKKALLLLNWWKF